MNLSKRAVCAAVFSGALLAPGLALAADCQDLAKARPPGARVTAATIVETGAGASVLGQGGTRIVDLPAFCRVQGVAASSIGFEVWLPVHGWNGRLLSVGNGGFGGVQPIAALAEGLAQGFAVTGNDTGHQGQGRAWMRDREQIRYWGHSATHLATGPAKALVAAFYAQPARYAYFTGCSTGGAQAMEEAEFYPRDYDGIVAGAPGMSYAHLMLSFLWGLKATDRPGAALPPEKLKLLAGAVLSACDARDGLKDGLISDPLACRFDPGALRCAGVETPECLTAAQVETVRLIYAGPHNPRTGAALYPGFVPGSEADPASANGGGVAYGWAGIQGPLAQTFAIPLLRDMVFQDPAWDWRTFDWDRDVAELDRRVGADITAVNPDLRAFAARGGKLIMYQGWGDQLNAQSLPVAYRQQVIERFAQGRGGETAARRKVGGFFRLFMAPGMAHCGGGPGFSQFDALTALRAWVEAGDPPKALIATHPAFASQEPPPTRPLCPFPAVAVYEGHGDPRRAASFACREHSAD